MMNEKQKTWADMALTAVLVFAGVTLCVGLVSLLVFGDTSHGLPVFRLLLAVAVGVTKPFKLIRK
jgi:hypothetical protein